MTFPRLIACVFFALSAIATPAIAQSVGEVVNVTPGASIIRSGGRVTVAPSTAVEQGDTIVTNGSGIVEIIFNDDTKLAVGPRSRLKITDVLMNGANRAEKFKLRTVSGTFRFLSGKSRKEVYDIRTPSANLGIRGTEFDWRIVSNSLLNVAGFGGRIQMTNRNGSSAIVFGTCSVGTAPRFSPVNAPESKEERDAILLQDFPWVLDQSPLSTQFYLNTASCGSIGPVPATVQPPRKDSNPGPQVQEDGDSPERESEPECEECNDDYYDDYDEEIPS